MARQHHETDSVRRFLLKQLSDIEQQEIVMRLLTDDDFSNELEIAEDELIDEYLAGELSETDRESFKQHFLTTPERDSKLRSAQVLKRYFDRDAPVPAPKPSSFNFWIWVRKSLLPDSLPGISSPAAIAITLLLVALAGIGIWRVAFYESDLQKGLVALNEAYRQERPIEARISTLDYAPYVGTRDNASKPVNTFELNRAERFLSDAEKDRANAASAHALGKLYLLQREFDKAIQYLERAAKGDPKNAQIYADLGAAYLEKGGLNLDIGDLGRSLEYLKQSLELDPNLLEALFNRGLVHEQQGLYQEAESDWRTYLEKDSTSQWAVDARTKLKKLEDRKGRGSKVDKVDTLIAALVASDNIAAWEIYQRNYTAAGNRMTKTLVDRLLAGTSASQPDQNLVALNDLGQLEIRNAEDSYTADLARFYASATPQTRMQLLDARRQVAEGIDLKDQSYLREAIELFADAQKTFDNVGDLPESLTSGILIAQAAALEPDTAKGEEIVERLVSTCEERRYKGILGQALFRRAHIQSNLNNYSEAITDSKKALQIFQDLNDQTGMVAAFAQLASLHLFINDYQTSFSFLKLAMMMAEEQSASPNLLWTIHSAVSLNLDALKLYRAALDYQHEALQLALALGKPLLISRSYQNIGLTYGAMREFDPAFENVRHAYEQGQSLAGKPNGKSMMASASLRLGDLYRASGDLTNALAAYEESSRLYEELDFDHYSYAGHKGKFLSYVAQNNDAQAAQELTIVLNLIEKSREKILEDRQTSLFFDKEQDVCDSGIDFTYFRLGDQRRAFDYSQICRARNLRNLMKHGAKVTAGASGLELRASQTGESGDALPLTGAEIQQQIPEQVQLIQYAVLEKRVVVWVITRQSEIFTKSIDVDSATLKETVTTALNQIKQRDDQGSADSLRHLYDLLIAPIKSQLDSNKVLCFIPDKDLHRFPFGALMSPISGRYLVQDYRVMVSPSATILIESSNKANARSAVRDERLLAVGNPTFDRSANPNLSNLASAEQEVEGIKSGYPLRRILIGPQATRKSVTEELPRAQVAHFAAHYQIDPQSQLSSKVLLAPEPGDRAHAQLSGLSSGDIYQLDLTQTKLVVLSACQTGIEQQLGGEGPIGFARSFLVAGVPVVVASLWPVDSEATAELMILFHSFRRVDHLSTTEALTRAQQEIMTREKYRQPYYWAGFTAIGGYSDF